MDANELGRWTRFAVKGGIGKCFAVQDCIAEESEDLMFMKDDEIIVLMQIPAQDDAYLGYCEGVVGRFRGSDVRFQGRLKKPVMAKRSSRSLSRSSSRPSSSQGPGPAPGRESVLNTAHGESPSLLSSALRMSYSHSGMTMSSHDTPTTSPNISAVSSPLLASSSLQPPSSPHVSLSSGAPDEFSHMRSASHSSSSTAMDSAPRTPADFSKDEPSDLIRIASLPRQVDSPTGIVDEDIEEPQKSAITVAVIGHEAELVIPEVHEPTLHGPDAASDGLQYGDDDIGNDSSFIEEPSPRFSRAFSDGDGETGIGLSLLQDFMGGDVDDADSVRSSTSGAPTPEPSGSTQPGSPASTVEKIPTPSIRSVAMSDRPSVYSSSSPKSSQFALAADGPSTAPSSPRDASSRNSGHPSMTDSDYCAEEWEGASDIYDNYRYSRYSMASRASRLSKGSMYTVASNFGLEAPPPVPFDGRPSLDSVRHNFGPGRERMGSNATASSSVEDVRRVIAADASVTSASSSPKEPGTPEGRRIPPPLELKSSQHEKQLSVTSPLSDQSASPLLHASFNSPLSSPDPTSAGFSPASPPLFSNMIGGAASALRQRLESERTVGLSVPEDYSLAAGPNSHGKARLSSQPIVVEDDDEGPDSAATPASPSTTSSSQPTSPSYLSEKKRMIQTTYIVANQAPPPPYTPLSPTTDSHVQPQPQPQAEGSRSTQLAPAGQHVPRPRNLDAAPQNEFVRRSLFAPHPHAPKLISSPTGPSGPMYGRSPVVAGQVATHAGPPAGGIIQTIHMALASQGDPYRPHRITIYAKFDRDLSSSVGPVPVSFTLQPPNDIPANKIRAMTAPSNSEPVRASMPVEGVPEASSSDPRANFFPKASKPRPRSRSFSGFDSTAAEIMLPESMSTEDGASIAQSKSLDVLTRRSKSAHSPSPPPGGSPSTSVVQPLAGPAASSARTVHKPSPLSLSQNIVVASPMSTSRKSPSSPPVRSPVFAASSPTSPLMSPSSVGRTSSAFSPPSSSSPLPNSDIPSGQVARSISASSDNHNSGPPSPLKYRPPHILRHSRSSVLSSRQSGTRDVSPSRTSVRPSAESDRSYHSDARSLASPISYSTPPMPHTLRTKLSLPALKIRGSDRSVNQDQPSPTLSTLSLTPSEDKPRVHIKDTDFELVKPAGQQLAIIDEDSSSPIPPSPLRLDVASLRASSPAFSTISGISSRTAPLSVQPDPLPRVVSEVQPSEPHDVEAHRQRELRWISIISSVPASQARKNKKVRKLLWEGVPASVRYLVWAHLTDSKSKRIDNIYYQLTQRERIPASANIERDLVRVFPNDHQLHDGSLLNILQAYLTMVPDLHYSRGLTVIAGHLLLQSPEEDAFWTFVSLMDTHIRSYFSASPAQMEVDATLFGKAVESNDAALAKKVFVDMDIPPVSLCRPWFSALFLEALPLEHSQRVWDIFLFEGVPFLFRVGLAIISRCKSQVMQTSERDAVLHLLLHPPSTVLPNTADAFLELTTSVKLKDEDLRKQRIKLFDAHMKRQAQTRTLASQTNSIGSVAPSISLPRK